MLGLLHFPTGNRWRVEWLTRAGVFEHNRSYPRAASSIIRSVYLASENLRELTIIPYTVRLCFGCVYMYNIHTLVQQDCFLDGLWFVRRKQAHRFRRSRYAARSQPFFNM